MKGKLLKRFNFENDSKSSILDIFEASDISEIFPKTHVELIATLHIETTNIFFRFHLWHDHFSWLFSNGQGYSL